MIINLDSTNYKSSGIYKIINTNNGDFYIGSAVNLKLRYNVHMHHLLNSTHANKILQNLFNKYGKELFSFELYKICDRSQLIEEEQKAINDLNPKYNIQRHVKKTNIGLKQSKESIEKRTKTCRETGVYISNGKISSSVNIGNKYRLGSKLSDETKIKIGLKSKGRIVSQETRNKISTSNKGKIFSDETIKKISSKLKGNKNGNGHKTTEDHKNKLRELFSKKIDQFTMDGIYINTFLGTNEAAKSVNGSPGCIFLVMSGKRKSHKNFIWKWKI